MKRFAIAAFSLAGFALVGPARADDLPGTDRYLCACASGAPDELDIPQFIEVDMNLKRAEGKIVRQGLENQRGYSFLIDEKTGSMAVAVARDGCSVTAFGSCTPQPAAK